MYVSVSRLRIPEDRAGALVRAFRDRERLEHLHTYEVVAE